MMNPIERRKPNLATTEDEWREAEETYKAGESLMSIAHRLDLAFATVSQHMQRKGIFRRDHPTRRRAAPKAPVTASGKPMPRLKLPKNADAIATADALEDWSQRLLRAEFHVQAREATRMAREKLSGLSVRMRVTAAAAAGGAVADAEFEAVVRPGARPVLREAQTPPRCARDGVDWRTWLFLGGRGAGKTLAGAAWLAGRAKDVGRLALIGPTLLDVRDVMIEGPSGLRGAAAAFGPKGERPVYIPSRRRLVWSNGATARVFTAEDPDGLRGPQFAAAWADEVCAWPAPEATLAVLRMGLRLGNDPRLVLTTTPRPTPGLRALLAEPGLAVTRGSALDNADHLAPGFVDGLRALYGGTRLERQEIDGQVLEAPEGGVFRYADIAAARDRGRGERPARFARLVVAVDPPAGLSGAACGIVVAGLAASDAGAARASDGVAWVLEDRTAAGLTPGGWAARVRAAAEAASALGPVEVVAEANQGGEMVREVLRGAGLGRPDLTVKNLRLVHATLGKRARAEPVGLLYEQGRVAHAAGLQALEDQLLLLGAGEDGPRRGEGRNPSPDRADALVWAITELMGRRAEPRVRVL